MNFILAVPLVISFFTTIFLTPIWINKARQIGLIWEDMNKHAKNKVAGSGGIIVVLSFIIGLLIFIAYRTFYLNSTEYIIEVFALTTSILLLASIGLVDDLFGWQRGGLSIKSRLILIAISSIPLIAINAGKSVISIPFFGAVDLGLIYPLVLIPLGIIGASTTFNILEGFNGLGAGQGILILSSLGIVAFFTGSSWLAIIAFCMVVALMGFLFYNFYPATVFPGDCLTYPLGGLIACLSILGNFEKVAVFFFIPYAIEAVLKSRGKLLKHSFGRPVNDGSLELKYDKIYSLNHLAIFILKKLNIKPTEKKAVYLIWSFQLAVIVLGLILFSGGIFK
jgi:UDP-N-acetylglucosamine--dolichyl-phosphate N-acetylglucosaminephosphotransferase